MAIEPLAAEPTSTAAKVTTETVAPVTAAATAKPEAPAAPVVTEPAAKVEAAVESPEPVKEAPQVEKSVVPEKYELKLSKNSLLDPAYVAKIEAEAKAEGLSNEQAQGRLARDEQVAQNTLLAQQQAFKERAISWAKECESDKEIGGTAYKENVELAKRALDQFADASFKKILDESGLGNNPHLLRTFVRIGKKIGNDRLVTEGKAGGVPKEKRSKEDVFYGKKEKS